jgi:hypothetical protein
VPRGWGESGSGVPALAPAVRGVALPECSEARSAGRVWPWKVLVRGTEHAPGQATASASLTQRSPTQGGCGCVRAESGAAYLYLMLGMPRRSRAGELRQGASCAPLGPVTLVNDHPDGLAFEWYAPQCPAVLTARFVADEPLTALV